MVTNICFSLKYGELLASQEHNAIFQVQMAVRFRLRFCSLLPRIVLSQHMNILNDYSASIFRYKINVVKAWLVYTDKLQGLWSLTSAGGRGKRKSGQSQQQVWAETLRAAVVKLNFYLNHFCPEDRSSIFERLVYTRLALWMLHCPVVLYCDPLCAFMASYRTNCTFTFTSIPFPAGHCTVRSASTCAVPGFASRRAAQVSAITASRCKWSRPYGGSGRGALSEEGTTKHWYSSR
jgi:hypothetical protein